MVLVPELRREDRERHERLIRDYSNKVISTDSVEIGVVGNGAEKGVYRVRFGDQSYIAAAATIDASRSLLQEYNILHHLFVTAAEFFPRPIAHYKPEASELGELILMELLEHQDLGKFKREGNIPRNFPKKLAYELGKAVASVSLRTGRYASEPHDGNVLVKIVGEEETPELKFCDAIQYRQGTLEDAARAILSNRDERPEAYRFIRQFRDGLVESMCRIEGVSLADAKRRLEFLREYNDVFTD